MKSNLNKISVAIVCNNKPMVKQIKQELKNKYPMINFVDISSDSGGTKNTKKIKALLRHCNLICIVISYVGHGIVNILNKLNRTDFLDGELLKIQGGKGTTSILKQIIDRVSLVV